MPHHTDIVAQLGPPSISVVQFGWTGGVYSMETEFNAGNYAPASVKHSTNNISQSLSSTEIPDGAHFVIAADGYRTAASGTTDVSNFGIGFRLSTDTTKVIFLLSNRPGITANWLLLKQTNLSLVTAGSTPTNAVWYRMVLSVKLHAVDGYVRAYIDDASTPFMDFTGDTIAELGTSTFDRAVLIGNAQGRLSNILVASTTDANEKLDRWRMMYAGVFSQRPNAAGDINEQSAGTWDDVDEEPIDLLTEVELLPDDEFTVRLASAPTTARSVYAARIFERGNRVAAMGADNLHLFAFDGTDRQSSPLLPTPITATFNTWTTTVAPDGGDLSLAVVNSWQVGRHVGAY